MNLKSTLFILFTFTSTLIFAQKTKVSGIVKDALTNEPIIGAIVLYAEGKAVTTGIDGDYTLALDSGTYNLNASYVGYKSTNKKIEAKGKTIVIDFQLSTNELSEIEVVADIAIARETPVAFSNLDVKKIQEELGARDLPLLLNTTPGVYATSQGGGDGDARISIRGFNSQNVLVLLDGIPMNDMVNGRVFWSNWFGLDNLTRGVQVQRGLGASKLAIPAIGGTMNILTAGIESKRALVLKNEYGNNSNYRIGLSYSSGRKENGWAYNFAGSYKRNDGWFDNMYSRMWFYYGKVEKKIGAHLLGLSILGAPQTSAQRNFRIAQPVSAFNAEYANNQLGIDTNAFVGSIHREKGWRYNPSWNFLTRTADGETSPTIVNTSINQFHKPVFSLKDFISINEKLNVSIVSYASYGRGYGTQTDGIAPSYDPNNGRLDLQKVYDAHIASTNTLTGIKTASTWIRKNHNDHNWYGALATVNYKINNTLNFSGGLDGRLYKGFVYSTVGDLLGADVIAFNNTVANGSTFNQRNKNIKFDNLKKGDKYVQNLERYVRWLGSFGMLEFKKDKLSAFVNLSTAVSWYKQVNHFLPKQLLVGDSLIEISYYGSSADYPNASTPNPLALKDKDYVYEGIAYNRYSDGVRANQTKWKRLIGYTAKAGANYNLTEHMNVFMNLGYLNRAPFITFVFTTANKEFTHVDNEVIKSIELGYSYSSQLFSANINGYYTIWENRPTSTTLTNPSTQQTFNTTAAGMTARHQGVEMDAVYKINKIVSFEAMASVADWEWISKAYASVADDAGNITQENTIDPSGTKVSDAAQITAGLGIRIEPIKKLYIKPQFNYFGKNYSNLNFNNNEYNLSINPSSTVTVTNPNIGRQVWKMPDYYNLDVNIGYSFTIGKIKLDPRLTVLNAINAFYITDAQNNGYSGPTTPNHWQGGNAITFGATSASVNVGMGRRWLFSLVATF